MRDTTDAFQRFGPAAVVAGAAVWWAVCLAVVGPTYEPEAVPRWESIGNNAYWVRDVRWAMVASIVLAVVWAARGASRRSAVAVAGGVAWLAADTLLDRLDVAGYTAAVVAAVVALAVGGMGVLWGGRVDPSRAGRRGLVIAAVVAAAVAGAVGVVQSPTDVEPALHLSALVGVVLAALVSLGCSMAASTGPIPWGPVGAAAAVSVAAVTVYRIVGPGSPAALVSVLAPIALVALCFRLTDTGAARLLRAAAAFGVVYVVTLVLAVAAALGYGTSWITALADNPPINAADTDSVPTAIAVVAGLAAGILAIRMRRPETEPTARS